MNSSEEAVFQRSSLKRRGKIRRIMSSW